MVIIFCDYYRVAAETIDFQRTACLYGRMFSVVESLVQLFPGLSGFNGIRKHTDYMYAFMKKIVEEHYQTFDPNHERSVLDIYFHEMRKTQENNEPSFFFCKYCFKLLITYKRSLFYY